MQRKKSIVVLVGIVTVINSTLGSALPSGAIRFIALYFHVTNEPQLVLPISMYLVGYVLGPLLFGPLSETFGRKRIMTATFCSYTIFTMACALAPNWPALLVFRLLAGIAASCPVSVVGGLYADIFSDPVTRGRAMALFMAVCTCAAFPTQNLLMFQGHDFWSAPRPDRFGLHLRAQLEVGFLDRFHHCRRVCYPCAVPAGNIRTSHP